MAPLVFFFVLIGCGDYFAVGFAPRKFSLRDDLFDLLCGIQ